MQQVVLLLFLPFVACATELTAPALSPSERENLYRKSGMNYAKELYLENNGSADDEIRSKRSEALNQQIRSRGIAKLEAHLAKTGDKRVRREVLHRLSLLYEQQAEVIGRRGDLKDRETVALTALRSASRHLESLRREFPDWAPDTVLFRIAENHNKRKEFAAAERYYREIATKYPKSPVVADSLLALGNVYFERQLFAAARAFYRRMLDTPEVNLHPYAHYKVAWCYFNERDVHAAVTGLEKAILESRKILQNSEKRLGVEEEALSDLVLFYAEGGDAGNAKIHFERLANKEKANELRYFLARKLFEDGKHQLAKVAARQLLDEDTQNEYANKLYLILISVAERTKDREGGLKTTEQLADWLQRERLVKKDTVRIETEEYMRHYSQNLHYEAETLKQKEVWEAAKKSYEIYLKAFPDEAETPEVKYRYAVLLMNRKEQLNAYRFVSEAITKMDSKNVRFREALQLRLQTIELAAKEERKKIPDAEALGAYDSYAVAFPLEELGIEAAFKAASLAKALEAPEKTALRFRAIAEAHPKHQLAKTAIAETLAVLVKAQKWEALGAQSRALAEQTEIQSSLLAQDESLKKKIAEARELANVKITEELEQSGKFEEASIQYEKILSDAPSEALGIYAYTRLASLAEQKLGRNRDGIRYFEALRRKYPSARESRQASLELGRLCERVNDPRGAAAHYLDFAHTGKGKLETQAMTNAAVVLASLGEREQAAAVFFELSEAQKASSEGMVAFEEGCNNMLLASHQNRETKLLRKIHDCAHQLASTGKQPLPWQARAAWALDQMADSRQAEKSWKEIAARSLQATPEAEHAYVAMARLKLLESALTRFKDLHFVKTNERPEANIGKKTRSLEELEKYAESVIKIGTAKQIVGAKNILRLAYLDFAEVMETAALPSGLKTNEKEELKKSFLEFAQNFRNKASELAPQEEQKRELASVQTKPPKDQWELGALSSEEKGWLGSGQIPEMKAAEVYAKQAYALFQSGRFGEARYFSEKWKKLSPSASASYGIPALEHFQAMLAEKLPEVDPVSQEFYF